jgi:hypothetical protein
MKKARVMVHTYAFLIKKSTSMYLISYLEIRRGKKFEQSVPGRRR